MDQNMSAALVVAAATIAAALIGLFAYRKWGRRDSASTAGAAPVVRVARGDRVVPPRRIRGDAVAVTERVAAGDYSEFDWDGRIVRVVVKDIGERRIVPESPDVPYQSVGATIHMDTGGGLVYGGPSCIHAGVNEYFVPEAGSRQEEPASVYYFHTLYGSFVFFRLIVDHVNLQAREVTLKVFFGSNRSIEDLSLAE